MKRTHPIPWLREHPFAADIMLAAADCPIVDEMVDPNADQVVDRMRAFGD